MPSLLVTSRKRSAFRSTNHCQGQLQISQSLSILFSITADVKNDCSCIFTSVLSYGVHRDNFRLFTAWTTCTGCLIYKREAGELKTFLYDRVAEPQTFWHTQFFWRPMSFSADYEQGSDHLWVVEGEFRIVIWDWQLSVWDKGGLLTARSKSPELLKKFTAFYGTRRFIPTFTRARHLSLSRARLIQTMFSKPTSWRPILILSSHLRLGLSSGLLSSGFPIKTLYESLLSPLRAKSHIPFPLLRSYRRISPVRSLIFG